MTIAKLIMGFLLTALLTACQQQKDGNTLKVGTIAGPETELMQVAKKVAAKKGVNLEIVEFSDYVMPNTALNDGSIDANMFQHQPYLEQTVKDRGYAIVAIGKTFIYPMGGYSRKIHRLADLPAGAKIAIPNDPSNAARALLLLQKAGLVKLQEGKDTAATIKDIIANPKNLQFIELDAAQLPRALDDVDLAVINTNYAIPAGLIPTKDALIIEGPDSLYANVIAVRKAEQNNPKLQEIVAALHSGEVKQTAQRLFHKQAIPAW